MNTDDEKELNRAAYRRLSDAINHRYQRGRYVAIAGGEIIADAAQFGELESSLHAIGRDSVDVLVVQAGVDYPESAVIFI